MYIYNHIDQRLVDDRVALFRDQTRRFLNGSLGEDDFRPLRLQNGLYVQRQSPMLRVANRYGRRDNKYKARIKILVKDLTLEGFSREVESEWSHSKNGRNAISEAGFAAMEAFFSGPPSLKQPPHDPDDADALRNNRAYSRWVKRNVAMHRQPGYRIVTLTLKKTGVPPGDATADQMDVISVLADRFGAGEIRVTHEQNLLLPYVPREDLFELWAIASAYGLAIPNAGLLTDVVCCPGGDFCSLANAKSIPVANAIQERFDKLDYLFDLGPLELNISGCVNACGHHHIGHIGILGIDKDNEEWYQITIGGREGKRSNIGKVIGRSFAAADIPDIIVILLETYIRLRNDDELFIDTVERVGLGPFRIAVYGGAHEANH